jgi:hypothetical protein
MRTQFQIYQIENNNFIYRFFITVQKQNKNEEKKGYREQQDFFSFAPCVSRQISLIWLGVCQADFTLLKYLFPSKSLCSLLFSHLYLSCCHQSPQQCACRNLSFLFFSLSSSSHKPSPNPSPLSPTMNSSGVKRMKIRVPYRH